MWWCSVSLYRSCSRVDQRHVIVEWEEMMMMTLGESVRPCCLILSERKPVTVRYFSGLPMRRWPAVPMESTLRLTTPCHNTALCTHVKYISIRKYTPEIWTRQTDWSYIGNITYLSYYCTPQLMSCCLSVIDNGTWQHTYIYYSQVHCQWYNNLFWISLSY